MESQERREQDIEPIAKTNQVVPDEECDSAEGDEGEQLETSAQQAGREGERHGAKLERSRKPGQGGIGYRLSAIEEPPNS
jgi:hypothetical protein